MRTVLFVAPFLMDATLRYVQAAASVPAVRLVVVTQDGPERLPRGVHHWRVDDALDPARLVQAARDVARHTGGIHRVLGILENVQDQVAAVREALGIPGPGTEVARRFRDKALMKTVLAGAGLPVARHRLLRAEGEAWDFVREVGFPVVLKPPAGAGCKATYRVNDADAFRAAIADTRPSPERLVLAEEFVSGDEHSYDTVTIDGVPVFHNVLRYLPGPLDVTRNDWIQWCAIAPRDLSPYDAVRGVGAAAIRALGLRTGFTHMEWFRRADGSAVISEIGARPPGAQFTSVMSWACDRSLYRAWADAVIDERLEGPFTRRYAAGIAYLRGAGQGRVSRVDGLDRAQERVGHLVVEARLPVVGQPKSSSYEGDGFAIVRHPDDRVVEAALKTLIETVQVHYA